MAVLFVNQLTVIDCSYLDANRGIVGESWIVDVELEGELNPEGMIFDFGLVKKEIKYFFDDMLDHRLLIPAAMSGLKKQDLAGERMTVTWGSGASASSMTSPANAIQFIDAEQITSNALIAFATSRLQAILPDNIQRVGLTLRYEDIPGAYYHYSHGLKKHNGACQHIAHGHRSAIKIFNDGQRLPNVEQYWASRFADIYLGTCEDVVTETETTISFRYQAQKGEFELTVPRNTVELLETETTVEQIAQYIYQQTQIEFPEYTSLKVMAFEGVEKGAMAGG